ncbi:MAG: DNA primase small subunit domain-containing protein, partial [Planctomycetota bacterium]
ACVTPHIWLSRVDNLRRPDLMLLDLDPAGEPDPEMLRRAGRQVRDLLSGELGLPAYLQTTGSKGFHVAVPLTAEEDFDEVRDFAAGAAQLLAERNPDELTVETRKDKRKGRIFVDYLRNSYAQTFAAPYSVRARPGAPIATPIEWDELGDVEPRKYNIRNIFRRLGHKTDPWAEMWKHAVSLDDARDKLTEIGS